MKFFKDSINEVNRNCLCDRTVTMPRRGLGSTPELEEIFLNFFKEKTIYPQWHQFLLWTSSSREHYHFTCSIWHGVIVSIAVDKSAG